MDVGHYSFLFSEMLGVRIKLKQFEEACSEIFPSCKVYIIDFSRFNKIIRILLGFNRGWYLPWFSKDAIIIRHNFFDPSLVLCLLVRKVLGKKSFLEHHSDHISEFKLRGLGGHFLAFYEILNCRLFNSLIDGHICVSESIKSIQKNYFTSSEFEVIENGYSKNRTKSKSLFRSQKDKNRLLLIMVAANFSPWHGLQRLNNLATKDSFFRDNFKVLLIGNYNKQIVYPDFLTTGSLETEEVNNLIDEADICVDSLQLSLLGLNHSSSLKGKQYISIGKPILSEFTLDRRYDDFTFLIDDYPNFGKRLWDWYHAIDFIELKKTSDELYDTKISWNAVVGEINDFIIRMNV